MRPCEKNNYDKYRYESCNFNGQYFQISYDINNNRYMLQDLNSIIKTFIKLNSDIVLKDKTIINIGDSYLSFSIGMEDISINSDNIDSAENAEKLIIKLLSNKYEVINQS